MNSVKRRQDICAWCFIAIFIINFTFQLMKYTGVLAEDFSWYVLVLGACAVAGFVFLYTLSSNVASEIFAVGQIGIEFYFWLVLPFLQRTVNDGNMDEYRAVYYLCMGFCVLSMYFWSVLLNSNDFSSSDMRWLVFLPMSYLLNICEYWCMIGASLGIGPLIDSWLIDNNFFLPMRWTLMPAMVVGYWKLSHSAWYAGGNSGLGFPSFSPQNKYLATYMVAVLAILIIF